MSTTVPESDDEDDEVVESEAADKLRRVRRNSSICSRGKLLIYVLRLNLLL